MNAAFRNATRLYEDADLLFKQERYPTACSLAILSIEEAGKIPLLRAMVGVTDESTLKERWKGYRNHQAKNVAWVISDLVAKSAKTLQDLAPMLDETSEHPVLIDVIKQLGFYSDCYGNAHWSEPAVVMDKKMTKQMMFLARVLLPRREMKVREIELWNKHVTPHWGTPEMMQGAVNYHKALIEEGLDNSTMEEIEAFYGTKGQEQKAQ